MKNKLFTSSYIPTLERKNKIESDNHIWHSYLTFTFDIYIWHLHLTVTSDICIWHLYLTVTFDIYIWHLSLTFISDLDIWHLYLTFAFDSYVWHLSLTFISDISIWHLCLACGSIHFPRLFSKQSWKMYWIHISRLFSKQSWKMYWSEIIEDSCEKLSNSIHLYGKFQKTAARIGDTDPNWRLRSSPIVENKMCIFLM